MSNDVQRPFYLVSLSKLTILFFATQGAFALVWFFCIGRPKMPARRKSPLGATGHFQYFYVGDLCNRLRQEQLKQGVDYIWSPQRLSLVLFWPIWRNL